MFLKPVWVGKINGVGVYATHSVMIWAARSGAMDVFSILSRDICENTYMAPLCAVHGGSGTNFLYFNLKGCKRLPKKLPLVKKITKMQKNLVKLSYLAQKRP